MSNKRAKILLSTSMVEVTLSQYVGAKIKDLRKERRISQLDLATYIGITRTSLSNIENGKYLISVDYIKMICDYFNIHSSHLLPF
jgi:transcriptional regulator with XRE-family HTH domain